MIDQHIIEDVKNKLVQVYDPREIYLFGSYAWGCPDDESDLDLLVIVDTISKDRYQALVDGHKALKNLRYPKDLLIVSKEEFDTDSQNVSTLYYKIRKQGKKIYAKA